MSKILLAPYSVQVFNKENRKSALQFETCFKSTSILNEAESFLLSLKDSFSDAKESNSLIRVKETNKIAGKHLLTGIVETGDYGVESTFYNRKGEHQYLRKQDHAEIMPFYFCVNLDPKKDIGIIILQRFGQYGISKMFLTRLKEYLRVKYKDLHIVIEPVISDRVLQNIVSQGAIKKVTFSKYEVPRDLASHFSDSSTKEIEGYMQMSIVAKKGRKLNLNERLNKLLFGNGEVNSLLKINNFDYDSTKVQVEHNGTIRTIDIGNFRFRAYYDVTSDVKRRADLHPEFDSVNSIAQNLLVELSKLSK